MKKSIVSTTIAATLLIGIGTTSIANAYEWAQGGRWSHGVGSTYVWSYYSHNSKYHGSSVIGKYSSSSGRVSPGYQAQASAPKAYWGNKAYYKTY